jgi:hypothetical protein
MRDDGPSREIDLGFSSGLSRSVAQLDAPAKPSNEWMRILTLLQTDRYAAWKEWG